MSCSLNSKGKWGPWGREAGGKITPEMLRNSILAWIVHFEILGGFLNFGGFPQRGLE